MTSCERHSPLPGGKLDEGETPEGALVRELYEELGIQVVGFLLLVYLLNS